MVQESSKPLILRTVEDRVGYLTLDRSDHLNAFNLELAEQFLEALQNCEQDQAVRAVVIRGAGKVFSVGGDVKQMLDYVEEGEDRAAYFRAPLSTFHRMVLSIRESPKPVLAAVHGAVAGVAFNVVLACDLRIAQAGTRFVEAFIKLGLSPDGGGSYFLPQLTGYARACELTMLPTEIDADTALAWGLINWVVPDEDFADKVTEIAKKLACAPSEAITRTKLLLNRACHHGLAEHMEAERLAQIKNAAHSDFEEGLRAFLEKREARFRGRS